MPGEVPSSMPPLPTNTVLYNVSHQELGASSSSLALFQMNNCIFPRGETPKPQPQDHGEVRVGWVRVQGAGCPLPGGQRVGCSPLSLWVDAFSTIRTHEQQASLLGYCYFYFPLCLLWGLIRNCSVRKIRSGSLVIV